MYYTSNPPTDTCKVCMSKYQSIINGIASESTPLLYRPTVRRQRWSDKNTVILVGVLTFLLFLGLTIGFRLLMVETKEIEPSYVISLASRHNWKAAKVDKNKDLAAPANKLILAFTNSPDCHDQQNCIGAVRRLQEESLENNRSDIPYNFIVADDNRIYEGRGWQYAPEIVPYSDNSTLAIAFLGYPGLTKLTSIKKDLLIVMVNLSISHHKLQPCFRVLARPREKPHLQDLINVIQATITNDACG